MERHGRCKQPGIHIPLWVYLKQTLNVSAEEMMISVPVDSFSHGTEVPERGDHVYVRTIAGDRKLVSVHQLDRIDDIASAQGIHSPPDSDVFWMGNGTP
jgi:hypothetical protein